MDLKTKRQINNFGLKKQIAKIFRYIFFIDCDSLNRIEKQIDVNSTYEFSTAESNSKNNNNE